MFNIRQIPLNGDPSNRDQSFDKINIDLLCCRYWWLSEWQSQQMSFPYWRLYWNKNNGGYVVYKNKVYLDPESIIIIPPHTPFSTGIVNSGSEAFQPYVLKGGWIENHEMETTAAERGAMLHLFIHFRLGYAFDNVEPGIYIIPAGADHVSLIRQIITKLITGSFQFDQARSMDIYSLIFSVIGQLPQTIWKKRSMDLRILKGIDTMEQNIHNTRIENAQLAAEAKMAANSFARLFKEQTGYSPNKYLIRMRVELACTLLHHSDMNIKEIASLCGFSDRYYFTKTFTRLMKISPAAYRRNSMIN